DAAHHQRPDVGVGASRDQESAPFHLHRHRVTVLRPQESVGGGKGVCYHLLTGGDWRHERLRGGVGRRAYDSPQPVVTPGLGASTALYSIGSAVRITARRGAGPDISTASASVSVLHGSVYRKARASSPRPGGGYGPHSCADASLAEP